jgi:NitT/TauT family transport system permease protein
VVPGLFGVQLLWLWQVLTVGFELPPILLPSPAQIGHQLAAHPDLLWQDFRQTFLKSVLAEKKLFIIGDEDDLRELGQK